MFLNSTLHLVAPSAQTNSTPTNDVIVNIAFGIAGTAISAFTIYQGHRMWKLWRLNHADGYEEERELGMISRTTTDNYTSDAPDPVPGGTLPREPSPQPTDGENVDTGAADSSTGATTLPVDIQET
ncbi:MAG: hypothetical protein OHK93_004285 [Ramalina farinacea]|uniref:Uncharacterized protein n=1 Tax=Ramalina farinacea TaxID=258253 RepID=A0AA43QKQ5_9LECA|nr:hypothetical protein [Ramalina farinacea]